VFYGENQSPSPKAILPLEQYVVGGGQNRVMCVTCHNPHGTDLYTYDVTTTGDVRQVPDNNMLRLLDDDNTLCAACH
jgi:formate-dependent nitrite reductase cytochrome c552 subunit